MIAQAQKNKGGRPPIDPAIKADDVIRWKARPRDLEVLKALEQKKGLDRTNVLRLALYHLAEFEGVHSSVSQKENLPTAGAVSSAG